MITFHQRKMEDGSLEDKFLAQVFEDFFFYMYMDAVETSKACQETLIWHQITQYSLNH